MIRSAHESDAQAIAGIYNHYVINTIITFEEQPLPVHQVTARISAALESEMPWLVLEHEGLLVGYAYASRWNGRCAYRFSAETTIYLAHDQCGRGFGGSLYRGLFAELGQRGMHTVIGGIALPNPASVALHERLGMRKVAHFEQVGYKFGNWIDVGYWQGLL